MEWPDPAVPNSIIRSRTILSPAIALTYRSSSVAILKNEVDALKVQSPSKSEISATTLRGFGMLQHEVNLRFTTGKGRF